MTRGKLHAGQWLLSTALVELRDRPWTTYARSTFAPESPHENAYQCVPGGRSRNSRPLRQEHACALSLVVPMELPSQQARAHTHTHTHTHSPAGLSQTHTHATEVKRGSVHHRPENTWKSESVFGCQSSKVKVSHAILTHREHLARVVTAVEQLEVEVVGVPRRELQLDGVHRGVRVQGPRQGPVQGFVGVRGPLERVGRRALATPRGKKESNNW